MELVTLPRSVPVTPAYLSEGALAVWAEDIERVVACGAVEADSNCFATYCELEAAIRTAWLETTIPKAAYLVELRRLRELLGIAGYRSRLGKVSSNETPKASPFSAAPKSM